MRKGQRLLNQEGEQFGAFHLDNTGRFQRTSTGPFNLAHGERNLRGLYTTNSLSNRR